MNLNDTEVEAAQREVNDVARSLRDVIRRARGGANLQSLATDAEGLANRLEVLARDGRPYQAPQARQNGGGGNSEVMDALRSLGDRLDRIERRR